MRLLTRCRCRHDLAPLLAALAAGESGSVSGERLQEMRQLYVAGMRELMPPEAANATWLVDKVRPACPALSPYLC